MTIGKEPNWLTYAESGLIQERTRIDGPMIRLDYAHRAGGVRGGIQRPDLRGQRPPLQADYLRLG